MHTISMNIIIALIIIIITINIIITIITIIVVITTIVYGDRGQSSGGATCLTLLVESMVSFNSGEHCSKLW